MKPVESFPPKPGGGPPAAPPPPKTLADKIQSCAAASVDPDNPRRIIVRLAQAGAIDATAISLSQDMVFATMYMAGGGFSNHYMPLRHFLELFS